MYLASKNFDDLRLPSLGVNPAPGTSESIQHGIFAYFVPPVTLYALLGLIMWITKQGKTDLNDAKKKPIAEEKKGDDQ